MPAGQEEKGKSLVGYLVDMPVMEFQSMIGRVNMTALLNIMQALHGAYSHAVMVKDALIETVETDPQGSRAASGAVADLHAVLMRIEARYLLAKEAVKQRDSDTENAYWNLRNGGF